MKVKDLPKYCKLKDECDNCEYIHACNTYFDGGIPYDYDPLDWYEYFDWDTEIRKDKE